MVINYQHILSELINIAKKAQNVILAHYQDVSSFNPKFKHDKSPVTIADMASHNTISLGLKQLNDWPLISEESEIVDFAVRSKWKRYWLVDPLDGTREYLRRTGDFAINIALIEEHEPVIGLVWVPIANEGYYAIKGDPAIKLTANGPVMLRPHPSTLPLKVVASRSHGHDALGRFLEHLPEHLLLVRGSALKLCLVAEGAADIYPRFGATSEWDTAAAHCILKAVGGNIFDTNMQELKYNTKSSLINPSFIAVHDLNFSWGKYL